ncbi:MAG: hypothetical protein HY721_09665 [Planctomycetes bacterium]|nr:hypothetical protein [Planctomycetota bacterium]
MMGKKKLSVIRAELRRELARESGDPEKALERLIQKVKGKSAPDEREIKALWMLRDALAKLARPSRKVRRPAARA